MFDHLRKAPFSLDDQAIDWVRRTLASLSPTARIGQLFTQISMGDDPGERARIKALQPGGVTRFFSADRDAECARLAGFQADAAVPLLISADLEGSRMSLPFGTEVPNPLALAAVDDLQATRAIGRIMAAEARAIGINWSFTPVLDINAAFRSPIVATRGFGSDPDRIRAHALALAAEFQAHGVAATAKHWPGEGHDDRDQHLVTTRIPLTVEAWEATHGALYRAAIEAGVLAVMSAHIAFPAFIRSLIPDAREEAYVPASINPHLNRTLLRDRLGFNGVIVSDATPMAGFGAWGPRDRMLPQVISGGCDMILFSNDPEGDHRIIAAALADGRLTAAQVDQALIRVLGLKAALGLHRGVPAQAPAALGRPQDQALADQVTARAPTLVKDVQGTLPLSPARTPRVLVYSGGIISPIHPGGLAFDLPDLLRAEGFDVTLNDPRAPREPARV